MKVRVIQVRFREVRGKQGEDLTPASAEVGAGQYSRRFERAAEPFEVRSYAAGGVNEISAVETSGLFEEVSGSERYEDVEPAAARPQPEGAAEPQGDEQPGGAEQRQGARRPRAQK